MVKVDFVEICNVYVGKMIIKAAKRIFYSDKICRSYSDLTFGVTFFGTQCIFCYYNKCIKKLFGYARCDSMSGILIELGLPTADTIVHNSHVLFASHCSLSCSQIVQWFANVAVW